MSLDDVCNDVRRLKLEFDALSSCLIAEGFLNLDRFSAALHKSHFVETRRLHPCKLRSSLQEIMNSCLVASMLTKLLRFSESMHVCAASAMCNRGMRDVTTKRRVDSPLLFACGGCDGVDVLNVANRFDPLCDTWEALPPMHFPRHRHTAVAIGFRVFVCGGQILPGSSDEVKLNSAECFDAETCSWMDLPPMSQARAGHTAVEFAGSLYVMGGFLGQHHSIPGNRSQRATERSAESYDVQHNQWETLSRIPGAIRRSMQKSTAAVIDGQLYLCCGSGVNYNRNVEHFDMKSRTWETLKLNGNCNVGFREHHAAVVYSKHLYIFGGENSECVLNSAVCFNPELNQCHALPPMSTQRRHFSAAVVADRICICGGDDGEHVLTSAECFVPSLQRWEMLPAMSLPRRQFAAASSGGSLYVFGGDSGIHDTHCLSSAERFDSESCEWSMLPAMQQCSRSAAVLTVERCMLTKKSVKPPT